MCGIAGFLCSKNNSYLKNLKNLNSIKDILYHRGPDDHGLWYNNDEMISLGHTRLSIQDLSPAGHQPMKSFSKRYIMVYNGEIYNHLDLRNKLKSLSPNIIWKGTSDTETLLNSFDFWGVEKTLRMCSGMFSIALWDNLNKELILIRDRFGEKPMYFGLVENNFIFGSELKVFKKITNFTNEISRDSLNLFLRFAYIPSPKSIYKNIFKLSPGAILKINKDNLNEIINSSGDNYETYKIHKWWNAKDVFNSQSSNLYSNEEIAINDTEKLLTKSINSQLISDVPVGAFLSGGIDSSIVSSLMQKNLSKKIETFTIGFDDKNYDEASHAKKIAKHLGTDHNELILNQKETLNIIPTLSNVYDEPFADSSQIPTILISKFAKQKITVALTGDGGDELFGGYNRYIFAKKFWKLMSNFPFALRRGFAHSLDLFPVEFLNKFNFIFNLFVKSKVSFFGDKVSKFSHKMKFVKTIDDLFLSLLSTYQNTSSLVLNSRDESMQIFKKKNQLNFNNYETFMMFIDSQSYLPDDILCKVDRAAMSVSLETRVPFLDETVVEHSWRIPTKMKIRNNEGKWILKQILNKYIPRDLTERPKMGFGIPLGDWLRDKLKDWSEYHLEENKLKSQGYFNHEEVRKLWKDHQTKKRDWSSILWPILIFQSWLEENSKN